ncbi:redoxin family protein [Actinoplanes sp. NPDC089786]|uniref:redoxin family protein n=1 Tax=Actinoplanes sp. NPDC089786 TaxID=3155185 RepID=UPI0034427B29
MIRKLLVAALGLGLLAGCGTAAAPAAPPPAAPASPPAAPASASSAPGGPPAPAKVAASLAFAGKTLDGQAFDAATLAGKPALLWFWAPWCATCAGQASSVQEVQQEYAGKLGVLGIAGLGSNAEMHEFVSDLEIPDVRTLDDQAGAVWRKFGITQQSTYVLIDAQGKVVTSSYLDAVDLPAKVRTLVG